MKKRVFVSLVLAGVLVLNGCAAAAMQDDSNVLADVSESEEDTVGADSSSQPSVLILKQAVLPEGVSAADDGEEADDMSADEMEAYLMSEEYESWWETYRVLRDQSMEIQPDLMEFYTQSMGELLAGDENKVISPVNVYMALSLLAEITDGDTRAEILSVLCAGDIETVRERADILYCFNYKDTPIVQEHLANSLWLASDLTYNDGTLDMLAEQYHASSYAGAMGSDSMSAALREWINANTGNLLEDSVSQISTDPSALLELVSTIYLKAAWDEPFDVERTADGTFHGTNGDTDCPFMYREDTMSYYWGEKFGAVALSLSETGSAWFILPDEGYTPADLVEDEEVMNVLLQPGDYENCAYPMVHLTVPKFKVASSIDLAESLRSLGIERAFDPETSDFTGLTDAAMFISRVEHTAMLEVDEEGVTGAAYVDMMMAGASLPEEEIDFTVDRPFLMAIKSNDGALLFAAVVYDVCE